MFQSVYLLICCSKTFIFIQGRKESFMSVHIEARKGDIAETILLPGDPLRAKYIAENYLENAFCYNNIRGMLGFTGSYQGKKISIQGTGMGIPSIMIYINELIDDYGAKNLIRIGTCGAIQENVQVKDVILAMAASTDSSINAKFQGDFAPAANFELLYEAYQNAKQIMPNIHVGSVLTSDWFYEADTYWNIWKDYGIIAVEMETSALYTVAARKKVKALSILTVSDHIILNQHTSAQEREQTFSQMIKIAFSII